MKKTSTWIVLGLTAGILASGTAFAQQGEGGRKGQKDPAKAFTHIDADGSGGVTLEEFVAAHEARMAKREERRGDREMPHSGRTPPPPEEIFGMIDTDGNATISSEEFAAHADTRNAKRSEMMATRAFERMDADESGRVTLAEFTSAHEERAAKRAERQESRRKEEAKRTPPPADEIFSRIDSDGDETITQEELAEHLQNRKPMKGRKGQGNG